MISSYALASPGRRGPFLLFAFFPPLLCFLLCGKSPHKQRGSRPPSTIAISFPSILLCVSTRSRPDLSIAISTAPLSVQSAWSAYSNPSSLPATASYWVEYPRLALCCQKSQHFRANFCAARTRQNSTLYPLSPSTCLTLYILSLPIHPISSLNIAHRPPTGKYMPSLSIVPSHPHTRPS